MKPDLWKYENDVQARGYLTIAGIDEAGRGPLAGPVVSASVILPPDFPVGDINDSKKLSPTRREELYDIIYENSVSVGTGIVDSCEIDRINILRAALLSMMMSVENLHPQPDYLLIDGPHRIPSHLPQMPIKKGDSLSVSIAAASIVAKVTRDRLMERYHEEYPQFGFCHHKGYPTKRHKEAIKEHGCCYIHRRTFKGVKECI
jgi:ribonuclease HII